MTSANKRSNRSVDILKYTYGKKRKTEWQLFSHIFFHWESGDLEKLFGTKKIWVPKIQKLEPCKFNKHLFLKKLFEFRSSPRDIFFEKMFLEFDKSFSVIVKEFMFSEMKVSAKKLFLKKITIFTGKHIARPVTLLKRDSNTGVFPWILRNI